MAAFWIRPWSLQNEVSVANIIIGQKFGTSKRIDTIFNAFQSQLGFETNPSNIYYAYCMKETKKDILSTLIDIVVLSNRQECKFYRT